MSVLDELVAGAVEDAKAREAKVSLEQIKQIAAHVAEPLDATRWLRKADGIPVIAEIKRASPSKGHLSDIPDPASLAREYEVGGASAISCLTEGRRFLGSLDDFDKVKAAGTLNYLRGDKPKSIDVSSALVSFSCSQEARGVRVLLDTRSSNSGSLRPQVLLDAALSGVDPAYDSLKVRRTLQAHEDENSGLLVKPL